MGAAGFDGEVQRIVIGLRRLRGVLEANITEGLARTQAYALEMQADELHLVIFDRDSTKSRDSKVWHKVRDGVEIWGC